MRRSQYDPGQRVNLSVRLGDLVNDFTTAEVYQDFNAPFRHYPILRWWVDLALNAGHQPHAPHPEKRSPMISLAHLRPPKTEWCEYEVSASSLGRAPCRKDTTYRRNPPALLLKGYRCRTLVHTGLRSGARDPT